MRRETRDAHTAVERLDFPRRVLQGRATRAEWAQLLASLAPVYEALEAGLSAPCVACLLDPAVVRGAAIQADLHALSVGTRPVEASAAAHAYAAHLRDLATTRPLHLAAHAWLRYLGDLSGGAILASALRKHPGLAPAEMAFFEYPGIADVTAFKVDYRARLDRLVDDPADADALVAEARLGFRLNGDLFLAVSAPG